MKVLYIGGTGEISYECVRAGLAAGQDITLFNRGQRPEPLPDGAKQILGNKNDVAQLRAAAEQGFDVVCQFIAFTPEDLQRDLEAFGGRVGQYVFISSASAYQKPPRHYVVTEDTPLDNPHWQYSRNKQACEELLMQWHAAGQLPVTIVRPSYTYRRHFTTPLDGGDHWAWRLLQGKPVLCPGDGTSLWTVTHSEDFAKPFINLLGNERALGEAFHITDDAVYTWNQIWRAIAAALGTEAHIVHVPTDTLLRYRPQWEGTTLGDKAWSAVFDNSKLKRIAGDYRCTVSLEEGMRRVAEHYRATRAAAYEPDEAFHALIDRIAAEQSALGR